MSDHSMKSVIAEAERQIEEQEAARRKVEQNDARRCLESAKAELSSRVINSCISIVWTFICILGEVVAMAIIFNLGFNCFIAEWCNAKYVTYPMSLGFAFFIRFMMILWMLFATRTTKAAVDMFERFESTKMGKNNVKRAKERVLRTKD